MENKNLEETDVNEKQKARNGKSAMPMRTCLVMILAGVYVAYLWCFTLPECNKWC